MCAKNKNWSSKLVCYSLMVSSLPGCRYITLHKYSWLPTPDNLVSKYAATINITDNRELINMYWSQSLKWYDAETQSQLYCMSAAMPCFVTSWSLCLVSATPWCFSQSKSTTRSIICTTDLAHCMPIHLDDNIL